ncbi:MAG: N-acetyltransferase [Alphaproteobacteria bacterium]|nr:MAG: N-acetyltransferase [Alphaproteobacteria bacterium]
MGERQMSQDLADIVTERLILRPPVPEDAYVFNRELAKFEISSNLARVPHPYRLMSVEDWWHFNWDRKFPAEGIWRVICRRDDANRSCIGNFAIQPDIRPGAESLWSAGYWMAEEAWGQGYMTEALAGGLTFVRETWDPEKIVAGAFTDNPASRRVLEKNGFVMTHETTEWSEARQTKVPHWNFELVR